MTTTSEEWATLKVEYLALKEKIDKASTVRWSIYEINSHEIQGAQGTHFVLIDDFETQDDLCEYVLTHEDLIEKGLLVLKEHVYVDGMRKYVGGSDYDNYTYKQPVRHSKAFVYNGKNIDGFVKQKNKMRFVHIKEFNAESDTDSASAIIGDESQSFSLFPGDDEVDSDVEKESVSEAAEKEEKEEKEEEEEEDNDSATDESETDEDDEDDEEDPEFNTTMNIILKKEVK